MMLVPFATSILLATSALAQHEGQVLPRIQLVKGRQIIANWIVGQPVSTSSGLVDGHFAPYATEVSEYLGIPYAETPVDSLRFQPPVKYNGSSVLIATSFGYSCISVGSLKPANETWLQGLNATFLGAAIAASGEGTNVTSLTTPQNEDCLTLNIWTKPQTGEPDKAVMIFIYDGGYYAGSSSLPTTNGQFLANDQDVVVVTFNYRLSIFGFPGNPLSAPNLGLLDTRLAVEWVRDNIAEFGGDPSRITLFGQGTGGSMADLYSFAWTEDPVVQAYIPMSGTAVSIDLVSNSTAYANWFNTSSALGCGGARNNHTQVWECMLTKNATNIAKAAAPPADEGFAALRKFLPTVDNTIVFGNYTDRAPVPAPILVGNTDSEAGVYKLITPGWSNSSWREYEALHFGCPAAWRAGVNVKNGNPTWRYRYYASWPNLDLFNGLGGSGAWHGSDTILLFNTTPTIFIPNTPQEVAFGDYYRAAWATFAKDPFTGLSSYTAPNNTNTPWPGYNLSQRLSTTIRLGWHNQLGPNLVPSVSTNGTAIGRNGTMGNSTAQPEDFDVGCPTVWPAPPKPTNTTSGGGADTGTTGANATVTATETGTATATSTAGPTGGGGASSGGSSTSGMPFFSSWGIAERTLWVGLFVACFAFFASQ